MASTSTSTQPATPQPGSFRLPLLYRTFFLFIEPISALAGAYAAHFRPQAYLSLTHAASSPIHRPVPVSTTIVLSQLANLYLLFALNEALVLRSTRDIRVWKTVLFVLLVADFGHLWSVSPLGWEKYVDVMGWNAMDWGNLGFVYLGASLRIAFLADVGLGRGKGRVLKKARRD
jgi:hypothetical protein